MSFVVENYEYQTIITLQVQNPGYFECLALSRIIRKAADAKNRDIIINLSKLTALDNFFIEKLVSARNHCEKNNCIIALCGLEHEILSVFYLLRLDKYFEFYDNIEEAVLRKNRLVKRRLKVV